MRTVFISLFSLGYGVVADLMKTFQITSILFASMMTQINRHIPTRMMFFSCILITTGIINWCEGNIDIDIDLVWQTSTYPASATSGQIISKNFVKSDKNYPRNANFNLMENDTWAHWSKHRQTDHIILSFRLFMPVRKTIFDGHITKTSFSFNFLQTAPYAITIRPQATMWVKAEER